MLNAIITIPRKSQGVVSCSDIKDIAVPLQITGHVQNLDDDITIKIICNGKKDIIEKFIQSIRDLCGLEHVDVQYSKVITEFDDFQIKDEGCDLDMEILSRIEEITFTKEALAQAQDQTQETLIIIMNLERERLKVQRERLEIERERLKVQYEQIEIQKEILEKQKLMDMKQRLILKQHSEILKKHDLGLEKQDQTNHHIKKLSIEIIEIRKASGIFMEEKQKGDKKGWSIFMEN